MGKENTKENKKPELPRSGFQKKHVVNKVSLIAKRWNSKHSNKRQKSSQK